MCCHDVYFDKCSLEKGFLKPIGDVTYCCLSYQIISPFVANEVGASGFL